MFCTINLIESKKRFSRNIKIENCKIGEIDFLKVTVFKKSALSKIEKKLKNRVDLAIVSDNIKDMKFDKIIIYKNDSFLTNITKLTFKYIIKLTDVKPKNLSVCVIDKECQHPEFVYSLAKTVGIVKVVTDDVDKYLTVSEGVLDDFGTSLVISTTTQDANLGIDLNEEAKIWFNNHKNSYLITKKCVKIGAGLRKFVPAGINQCDFAGVLHKYNEFKRLKLLNADMLYKNGKYFEINENNIKNFLDNK